MMNQQICNVTRLGQFLGGDLSEHDEQLLTEHLDECQNCRDQLDSIAADRASWSEAKELLGDEFDSPGCAESRGTSHRQGSLQIEQVLAQLAPTDDPYSLGRIGGYEVTGIVGSGGMGVVLKAHDRSLNRLVAVKVMAPHLATSGSARQRFAQEAKAAAAVLHPNVIAIHGVSNDQALPYLVMPYVRGASLQKRIDDEGQLPTLDILRIGSQVAAGLAAAHEQGLVHRDIKPANILLELGIERVTITDFGLARAVDDAAITRSGVIAGTPQYMSPEQARGEVIDARSDLFSLGSLLYAMCTGHSPFRAETSYGVLHRITHDSPRPICEIKSNIPPWLEHIVLKLLSKSPDERFESAEEVAQVLEDCLAHIQHPTHHPLPKVASSLAQSASSVFGFLRSGIFIMSTVLVSITLAVFMMQPPADPNQDASRATGGSPAESNPTTAAVQFDGAQLLTQAFTHSEALSRMTGKFDFVLNIADSPPNERQIESTIEGARAALTTVIEQLQAKLSESPNSKGLQHTLNNYETALQKNSLTIRKGMLENSMRKFEYHYLIGPEATYIELKRVVTPEAPDRGVTKLLSPRFTQGKKTASIQFDSFNRMAIVSYNVSSGSQKPTNLGRLNGSLVSVLKYNPSVKASWFDVRKLEGANDRDTFEITSKVTLGRLAGFRLRVIPSLGFVTPLIQELDKSGNVIREWKSGTYFRVKNCDLWFPETVTFQENHPKKRIEVYTFEREKVAIGEDVTSPRISMQLSKGDQLMDARIENATLNYSIEAEANISLNDLEHLESILKDRKTNQHP